MARSKSKSEKAVTELTPTMSLFNNNEEVIDIMAGKQAPTARQAMAISNALLGFVPDKTGYIGTHRSSPLGVRSYAGRPGRSTPLARIRR